MYLAQVSFNIPEKGGRKKAEQAIYTLLGAWVKSGQANTFADLHLTSKGRLRAWLTIPEKRSLDKRHANKWVKKALRELKSQGVGKPSLVLKGRDVEGWCPCACKKSSAFVLKTDYLSSAPPVKCLDCFGVIPLYSLPASDHDEHYELLIWNDDYKACDTLQMNCRTGERFGIAQMSDHESSLARRGRELCREIEERTGTPTYYYLYRASGTRRTHDNESKRPCPSCGGAWLLDEPIAPIFDFQCKACRLVSNIAF